MPDAKITDLVDGTPLQPTDEFVVARGGDNFKIDGADIVSAATAAVTKHDVTISGNTAGVLAPISSGTWTLAGGNNITLSQVGNAVTISGANAGGAQTAISGLANSETTYTSGTVSLSELGALTIRSSAGQIFQFEVPATSSLSATGAVSISTNGSTISIGAATQSVQPETQTFIAGISASDTLYTSGNVRITGVGGGVTVSSNTGQRVDISVAAQSVQPETQTFIAGISASDTLYTSGNVRITGVGGGITVSSNTGQRIDLSVAAQSVQPETQTFIAGISASDTLYTSGNVRFTGSQAVTVRSGTGQLVVIDVPAQTVQPDTYLSIGVSTGGNTAGNTTVNTGSRFVLVGSGNLTASQGTAAGATTVTLSVAAQTAQTGISGIANSQTTYTSGTVSLSELGAITIRSTTGNQFQLSVNSQSVQTNDIPRLGVSTGGNTAGDTTVNSGTRMVFVGSNMVSLSQATAASASTITINATQSVQSQGILSVGASNIGNTSGNTTVNTGSRLVIAGGNNITISQGTAAGATTLTISAPNLGAGAMSAGASDLGNTAGSTGITGTQLVLVGSDNITLSQSTGANGGTLSIIGGGGGGFSAGVSTGGNTAGDTGVTGTRLVLVGNSPMSLSQATAAAGGTVSINAPATSSLSASGLVSISTNGSTISIGVPGSTVRQFDPHGMGSKIVGVFPGNATLAMQPWSVPAPYQHDRVMYPVHYSQATNSTLTVTVSGWFGLYTRNVSTLTLLSSGSGTFSINGSGTASSANNSGLNFLSFGWTNTVPPGQYWLGAVSRTTTAGANASLSNVAVNVGVSNSAWSGMMGVAAASTHQMQLGLGTWTVTTAGMPNTVGFSNLAGSASAAHRVPWIFFLSETV